MHADADGAKPDLSPSGAKVRIESHNHPAFRFAQNRLEDDLSDSTTKYERCDVMGVATTQATDNAHLEANDLALPRGSQSVTAGRPWLMKMNWHDLLFAHWPVDAKLLRPLVPDGLEIDTHEGHAYVGVIPFHMTGVRLRGLPPVPSIGSFVELNVRTYVKHGGHRGLPGVWFCTLDAGSWLSVRIARLWWGLNYLDANISVSQEDDWTTYRSQRRDSPAAFTGRYRPTGDPFTAKPGSLEHFLCERYILYTQRRNKLIRGAIAHTPWQLRHAELQIQTNTVGDALDLPLEGTPHTLCSQCPDVKFWGPEKM